MWLRVVPTCREERAGEEGGGLLPSQRPPTPKQQPPQPHWEPGSGHGAPRWHAAPKGAETQHRAENGVTQL